MKTRELLVVTAATAALVAGCGESGPSDNAPTQREIVLGQAATARAAIAKRYETCEIAKVTDHHEAKPQPASSIHDLRNRNRVDVTLTIKETPEALHYEQVYDNDDTVRWMPTQPMARIRIPNQRGELALGTPIPSKDIFAQPDHTADTVKFPLFPFAKRNEGTIGVFMAQTVETADNEGQRQYNNFGAKYCGTLVLKTEVNGSPEWQVDTTAAPMDDIYREETCDIVPSDDQPGLSYVDC